MKHEAVPGIGIPPLDMECTSHKKQTLTSAWHLRVVTEHKTAIDNILNKYASLSSLRPLQKELIA